MPDPDQIDDGERDDRVVRLRPRRQAGGPLDAVIVGAGAVGLACAWRAARRGLRVRVLDRGAPGAGASGVAAGMIAPVGEATWGEEGLARLAVDSAAAWPGFAAELAEESGGEVGYAPLGALRVALDRDEAAELHRRHELMASLGLEAAWLRGSECRRLEPGLATACVGGIHAPDDAAVDPRALVAALGRTGVEVVADAEVIAAQLAGDRIVGVRTADGGEHRAANVVLAAGAWSGASAWLPAEARPPVRPVKGQILTLRAPPGAAPCRGIVASERVYVVPREDGQVIVGATVEERGFDVSITAGGVHELLREAYRALPDIGELEFCEAVAGLRPGTPDNAPLVGRGVIEGLVLATGHYRHGILLAPLTAEIVAGLLAGEPLGERHAAADPMRFAAGPATGALAPAPEGTPR